MGRLKNILLFLFLVLICFPAFGAGVAINNQTEVTAVASNDIIPIYDLDATAGRRITVLNVMKALNSSLSGVAVLAVNGGTGQSSYTVGDILYADTTTTLARLTTGAAGTILIGKGASTAPEYLAAGTAGYFLKANGANDPVWTSQPTLTSLEGLTFTNGDVIYATAADTLAVLDNGTANYILQANGAAAPSWVTSLSLTGVDLSGVTDGQIPYMSASGFADSKFSFDGSYAFTIGDNSDNDFSLTFDGDTSNGVLNYDEDNADFEFDRDVYTSGSFSSAAVEDPFSFFDALDADDTDWYVGTNADAGASADDVFEFRTSSTPGSSVALSVDYTGSSSKLKTSGDAPALSSCGTNPSITGSDANGKITIGTGVTTSCTVTFDSTYTAAPSCVISGDNNGIGYAATTTATVLTITSSADMASDVISYWCIGIL